MSRIPGYNAAMTQTVLPLSELYLADETAWLDAMAELIGAGAFADLDYANLREYLQDMAIRDRREVRSRLKQLLFHILKWEHQPDKRTRSWRSSLVDQRQELVEMLKSRVLRKHAEEIVDDGYEKAVELASSETGLAPESFPAECPYSLDEILAYSTAE
jgi:hypothetical protein